MSYKILRIANINYSGAFDRLYAERPGLKEACYQEQLEAIFSLGMIYSDAFSNGMRALGIEAEEIIADADIIQSQWAREHQVETGKSPHSRALTVMAQIKHYQPDVVYFQDVHGLPHKYRKRLKSECPSVRLTVLHKGYPGQFEEMGDFDLVCLSLPSLVDLYREKGIPAELQYHGFNGAIPDMLANQGQADPDQRFDFTFIGSTGFGHGGGHRTRYWSLMRLFRDTPLVAFTDEVFSNTSSRKRRGEILARSLPGWMLGLARPVLRVLPKTGRVLAFSSQVENERSYRAGRKSILEAIPDDSTVPFCPIREFYPQRCLPPVYGLEMFAALAASRVTFNLHANATGASIGNIRMFEATGMGACLLTDSGPNVRELFEPDKEIVTYANMDECVEKLTYLLEHPEVRNEVARAGQRRTLKDHTVQKRVENMDALIRKRLAKI